MTCAIGNHAGTFAQQRAGCGGCGGYGDGYDDDDVVDDDDDDDDDEEL